MRSSTLCMRCLRALVSRKALQRRTAGGQGYQNTAHKVELVLTSLHSLGLLQAVQAERDAPCRLRAKTKAAQTLSLHRQQVRNSEQPQPATCCWSCTDSTSQSNHSLQPAAGPEENEHASPGACTLQGTASPFPAACRKQGQKEGLAVPGCTEGRNTHKVIVQCWRKVSTTSIRACSHTRQLLRSKILTTPASTSAGF